MLVPAMEGAVARPRRTSKPKPRRPRRLVRVVRMMPYMAAILALGMCVVALQAARREFGAPCGQCGKCTCT